MTGHILVKWPVRGRFAQLLTGHFTSMWLVTDRSFYEWLVKVMTGHLLVKWPVGGRSWPVLTSHILVKWLVGGRFVTGHIHDWSVAVQTTPWPAILLVCDRSQTAPQPVTNCPPTGHFTSKWPVMTSHIGGCCCRICHIFNHEESQQNKRQVQEVTYYYKKIIKKSTKMGEPVFWHSIVRKLIEK